MEILAWILAVVGFAVEVAVDLFDMWVTSHYPLYETGEKTNHFQDKDGYLSRKKAVTISAIVFGLSLIPAYWIGPLWIALWFGVALAVPHFIIVWGNYSRMKRERKKQFAILEAADFNYRPLITFRGQYVLTPFYDIRGSLPVDVYDKLVKLSLKPQTEWWKLDRAKSL